MPISMVHSSQTRLALANDGRLPLADGYTATFRNFDLQKQKVKVMQLKVAGKESVTVPAAGTFEAFRVEVSSADGGAEKTTLWIATEGRKPVKVSSVLPQMVEPC